ncbi:MAG: FkbM family methyltransferase [Verrucomicrobiota bacterium]
MSIADRISAFLYRRQWRGATRFHSTICGGRRIQLTTQHGICLALDPTEYIDSIIIRHGYYETEVLHAIQEALCPGQVFWDVGANLGIHALTIKSQYKDVQVCAFEPNPDMATLIDDAARINELQIQVCEIALDTTHRTVDLFRHQGNAGCSGLHNWDNNPELETIAVQARSGDELIALHETPAPHVIKMDVEGHEAEVLQGLAQTLQDRTLHTVVFEDNPKPDTPVKQILHQHGFEITSLSRLEPTHHKLENYQATRQAASHT